MNTKQTNDLHQHLLDMLGAKDHVDAARIIAELHAAQAHPSRGVVDVESALQRAYNLGQTYWQQADSEYASDHRKASETAATFRHLVIDTVAALPAVPAFDMLAHLQRQREWSGRTFGPGPRTAGVIDHIRKELREIEADPTDLSEWIDVVILALDGAWRAGGTPEQIIATLVAKQTKNEGRTWPDWRTADPDRAIEHDRAQDAQPAVDPQDLRHLIVMDTQFAWSGETSLKLPEIQRLELRGWVAEGHENGEYEITDGGRAAIDAALGAAR